MIRPSRAPTPPASDALPKALLRIVYFGTGEIGLPSLRWLLTAQGVRMAGVVTQPDRPAGRHLSAHPPAVKVLALEHGLPVFQPENLRKDEDVLAALEALQADIFVVMAYGQMLPRRVLQMPRLACVNLHASLLPRHRGASPIQSAILAGDAESGLSLMHVTARLDAGDVILTSPLPLSPEETGGGLHDRLADLGPGLLDRGLPLLADGSAPRMPQDEALVTIATKLDRQDGLIDWSQASDFLERKIRAYDPWPGTNTPVVTPRGPQRLKVFPPLTFVSSEPGEPSASPLQCNAAGEWHFRTGTPGVGIVPAKVQPEGKRPMTLAEFVRGYVTVA